MDQHPIEEIMRTTMENIKDMVDVNTIIGDAVFMADGTAIIPVSRVGFGFVSGGGEYGASGGNGNEKQNDDSEFHPYPFAGGSGASVSVNPVAFVVVSEGNVQLLPMQFNSPYDRIVELIPGIISDIKSMVTNREPQ